ncbi:hypothetical protein Hanom_Chr09g00821111 [Helianthus anomalus]
MGQTRHGFVISWTILVYMWLLHTKQRNSTQKASLVSERAHFVYEPHINCPYNRWGTSP